MRPAPRARRSPSSAGQPAGSISRSSGGNSCRRPGGRARAMAGDCGSRAGPRRVAPAGCGHRRRSAPGTPRQARTIPGDPGRRRCILSGRLRVRASAPSPAVLRMRKGWSLGNQDGPVQEDPGAGELAAGGLREASRGGRAQMVVVRVYSNPAVRRGPDSDSRASGAHAVRGPSEDLAAPLTYSLLLSPALARPLRTRGAGPDACLSTLMPRP